MRLRRILLATLIGFTWSLLVGCLGVRGLQTDPLDGTSWFIVSLDDRAPLPETAITVAFDAGALHGSSGCNELGGSYAIDRKRIRISDLHSTLMACLSPDGVMDQEQEFLALLSASDSYQVTDGHLRLLHSGRVVLDFTPGD